MTLFKILIPILTLISGLLQAGLDYKIQDRNSKLYRVLSFIFISTMIISTCLVIYFLNEEDKETKKLTTIINDISNKTYEAIKNAKDREKRAQDDNKALQDKLSVLSNKLDPIIVLAKNRYPLIDEEKAILKLITDLKSVQDQISPRQLTATQKEILIKMLSSRKGTFLIVASYVFDPESKDYGDQLSTAIKKAGWNVTHYKSSTNDFNGISISCISSRQILSPGYVELNAALKAAGINLKTIQIRQNSIVGSLPDGSILLAIGRK